MEHKKKQRQEPRNQRIKEQFLYLWWKFISDLTTGRLGWLTNPPTCWFKDVDLFCSWWVKVCLFYVYIFMAWFKTLASVSLIWILVTESKKQSLSFRFDFDKNVHYMYLQQRSSTWWLVQVLHRGVSIIVGMVNHAVNGHFFVFRPSLEVAISDTTLPVRDGVTDYCMADRNPTVVPLRPVFHCFHGHFYLETIYFPALVRIELWLIDTG